MPDVYVEISQPELRVNIGGAPGPQGPPGPVGGSVVTWPAGQNVSTGRVVIVDGGEIFYFQPSDATHQGRAYGITVTSGTTGSDIDVQLSGERSDAAFSFAADSPLWVDTDGVVVNAQPSGGVLIQGAGVASGAKKLVIDFSLSIKKN